MARYVYGWIECKERISEPDESSWKAVIHLQHLLPFLKDYSGFNCLFGEDPSSSIPFIKEAVATMYTSMGLIVGEDVPPFPAIAYQRGLPGDVSSPVEEEYRLFYKDALVGCASWVSWQELKQVDWDEKTEWIDPVVYAYQRNEAGELIRQGPSFKVQINERGELDPQPDSFSQLEDFESRIGLEQIDFSKAQAWDLGDLVYRTEKMQTTRREQVINWEDVFKVLEILAKKYGDDSVRVVAWLD